MAFDVKYPNRKDHRRAYRDARRFDRSCRNHGSCPYCAKGRKHFDTKRRVASTLDLREHDLQKPHTDP